jgi:hypothetical protein
MLKNTAKIKVKQSIVSYLDIAPVMSMHWCGINRSAPVTHLDQGETRLMYLPLVPQYPSQSSVPKRVQK